MGTFLAYDGRRVTAADNGDPTPPKVAVITPVYNGAAHIAGCVASVLAQDHQDWVHLVVDNASTDDTPRIVEGLAAADQRVRLIRFEEHLSMLGSWNRAMRQVPDGAEFVKHLGADDRMTPDCLTRMLAAAEDPRVAMVAARWREGTIVAPTRPVPDPFRVSGREAMRSWLLGGPDTFGTPSACLYRTAALDGIDALYPPEAWPPNHPDGEPGPSTDKIGYADILERGGFVFLPQVLTYDTDNAGAQSTVAERMRLQVPGDLDALLIVGQRFLDPDELRRRATSVTARYARSLTKAVALGRPLREPAFATLHHHLLEHIDGRLRDEGFRTARALLAPHRLVFRAAHARAVRHPAGH